MSLPTTAPARRTSASPSTSPPHLIASGKFVTTHQIRSLYPAGGLTYDLIRDLIAEVKEA
ncbi:hypothetical protein SEA_SHELOB_190 [Mycobacterium phage Shelob]|nr:hypothetical protein SEA_SHELOB_190 [Mycobacterium phage Shelob]